VRALRLFVGLAACAILIFACDGDKLIVIVPDQMPPAQVGQPFDVPITPVDSEGSGLTAMLKSGSLPPGIDLYRAPGNGTGHNGIRGTPTAAGTYTFTIELGGYCTMGGCTRGHRDYSLVVSP
jgi:hypothetical protein